MYVEGYEHGKQAVELGTVRLRARYRVSRAIRAHHRAAFIAQLPPAARVLDVGCGNGSPQVFKSLRPDLYYVGLDVGDYNQDRDSIAGADEYILVSPDRFDAAISALKGEFDAVISAHNLEHCNAPDKVVEAMAQSLRPGGVLFMLFPCAASVDFPSRIGTLNFFDDETHLSPPDLRRVTALLAENGLRLEFLAERYRPAVPALVGRIVEPISARRRKILNGTWAYHGFETVIWARATLD